MKKVKTSFPLIIFVIAAFAVICIAFIQERMMLASVEDLKDIWIPLITALISLISVFIAFMALLYSRRDRQEQQAAATADAKRREQDSLVLALQGDKESIGFLALQLIREPKLITAENQDRMFDALCLAFLFASSSRARALIFRALKDFSADAVRKKLISDRLEQIRRDVREYEQEFEPEGLTKYRERMERLQNLVGT